MDSKTQAMVLDLWQRIDKAAEEGHMTFAKHDKRGGTMKSLLVLLLFLQPGCLTESTPPPSCVDLGCPLEPSGSPEIWEPCDGELCWCRDSTLEAAPAIECVRGAQK